MLRMSKSEDPRWFPAQYEKLPYYCFSCGVIGHSEVECLNPVARDETGKLPYDVQLRAPEERRRRMQSFAVAAAESFGSGTSSSSRHPRPQRSKSGDGKTSRNEDGSRHSSECVGETENLDDQEVLSPLKNSGKSAAKERDGAGAGVSRQLDLGPSSDNQPLWTKKEEV